VAVLDLGVAILDAAIVLYALRLYGRSRALNVGRPLKPSRLATTAKFTSLMLAFHIALLAAWFSVGSIAPTRTERLVGVPAVSLADATTEQPPRWFDEYTWCASAIEPPAAAAAATAAAAAAAGGGGNSAGSAGVTSGETDGTAAAGSDGKSPTLSSAATAANVPRAARTWYTVFVMSHLIPLVLAVGLMALAARTGAAVNRFQIGIYIVTAVTVAAYTASCTTAGVLGARNSSLDQATADRTFFAVLFAFSGFALPLAIAGLVAFAATMPPMPPKGERYATENGSNSNNNNNSGNNSGNNSRGNNSGNNNSSNNSGNTGNPEPPQQHQEQQPSRGNVTNSVVPMDEAPNVCNGADDSVPMAQSSTVQPTAATTAQPTVPATVQPSVPETVQPTVPATVQPNVPVTVPQAVRAPAPSNMPQLERI
jgi:hypothetical protein